MAKKGIIKSVVAYEVLDSRGYPTVAAVVTTKDGAAGKAMVPSGASTGEREALELRDGDKARFMGKGVLKAVENVNTYIAELLKTGSFSVLDQASVDTAMIQLDQKLANSNDNFKKALGANATLAVSMAVTRAAANLLKKPLYKYIAENIIGKTDAVYTLPVPMLNVINGGEHADNTIDFQEFMFMPIGATSFKQSCQIASECFHSLAKILKKGGYNTSKGDEGGFAPALKNAEEALDSMVEAITAAGYKPGVNDGDVAIAMDTACSELYNDGVYEFKKAIKAENKTPGVGGNKKTTDQMITYLQSLVKDYPIISIEDGLAENDWDGWAQYNEQAGGTLQIVGDDIFCTNPVIVEQGIAKKVSNSVLIKLNQIGTVTETILTILAAKNNNWTAVVSHRSGETEDTFIADLAVALGTGQIKTGSMSRSERIAKYNRLIEIEIQLGSNAIFPGRKAFYNIKI